MKFLPSSFQLPKQERLLLRYIEATGESRRLVLHPDSWNIAASCSAGGKKHVFPQGFVRVGRKMNSWCYWRNTVTLNHSKSRSTLSLCLTLANKTANFPSKQTPLQNLHRSTLPVYIALCVWGVGRRNKSLIQILYLNVLFSFYYGWLYTIVLIHNICLWSSVYTKTHVWPWALCDFLFIHG